MTYATDIQTEYLTVAQVAAILGLSKMTVYRMCQEGTLAHIRTGARGKTYRIARTALDDHARAAQPAPAVIPGQTTIDTDA